MEYKQQKTILTEKFRIDIIELPKIIRKEKNKISRNNNHDTKGKI